MTSPNLEVHGESLQEIIHTLFTIHLSKENVLMYNNFNQQVKTQSIKLLQRLL